MAQLDESAQNHRREIDELRENLQKWLSLDDDSNVEGMIRSINEHFVAQDERRRRLMDNTSQTAPSMGMIDVTSETDRTVLTDRESQVDPIRTSIGETQTESLQELLSVVKTPQKQILKPFLRSVFSRTTVFSTIFPITNVFYSTSTNFRRRRRTNWSIVWGKNRRRS